MSLDIRRFDARKFDPAKLQKLNLFETPRFFLMQNGQLTASTAGNNGWRDYMWPTILDITNTKP